jgi:hypothetical protein
MRMAMRRATDRQTDSVERGAWSVERLCMVRRAWGVGRGVERGVA